MKHYDLIIVGGGVAGLSLAYHLAQSPLRGASILIVERDEKDRNDRTLAFWSDRRTCFDSIVYRSWERLRFVSDHFEKSFDLGSYRYQVIRGIDFYRFVRQALAELPNVEWLQGSAEGIDDGPDAATVWVDGQPFAGTWVFDSRFRLAHFDPDPARYRRLEQHFKGWVIETAEPTFDARTATMFDLRVPQQDELRFFYILPYSDRQALVEYVLLSNDHCEQTLKDYVENTLGIKDYRILEEEAGATPQSDYPFPRRVGQRVMQIGIAGGRVKPSTGYAFARILKDSAAITRSLVRRGHPFDVPDDGWRYRMFDAMLLDILQRDGDRVKGIFTGMFRRNPARRILRFLDEAAPLWENALLCLNMPLHLMADGILRVMLRRRVGRPLVRRLRRASAM